MTLEEFYKGKKVLITGNTGFKGTWLSMFLDYLGADIYGISQKKSNNDTLYQVCQLHKTVKQYYADIRNESKIKDIVHEVQPDVAFHLAAQPITLESYSDPLHTFSVNSMGTAIILDAFRDYFKNCNLVIVTSDKCYQNNEWVWGYRENDRLAGKDPYSASKSLAEIIFQSYYHSFYKTQNKIKVASCRSGNVIGGGDWGQYRIVPDCVEAWINNNSIEIRSPNSVRPWSYILDIIWGYLVTGFHLSTQNINGEAFNFGPQTSSEISVLELTKLLWSQWKPSHITPYIIKESPTYEKFEHQYLKLNIDKSNQILGWNSQTNIELASQLTIQWYLQYYHDKAEIKKLTQQMIEDYHTAIPAKKNYAS